MTLEQILSEFDEKAANGDFGNPLMFKTRESRWRVSVYFRTSFSKYQEELVAGIEGMRSDVHSKQIGSGEYQLGKLSVLNQVIKLIKEN